MMCRTSPQPHMLLVPSVLLFLFGCTETARAQFFNVGGVYVDAEGTLTESLTLSPDERLKLLRAESADPPGSRELVEGSALRKVSLKRLEQEVRKLHADGGALPAEVRYLAGLTGVKYIFLYPETEDVVLAGPAEAWRQVETGEVVGVKSNHPVLQLDDLIVALRYAFDKRPSAPFVGCSIDPSQEGVQRYAAYMNSLGQIDRSRLKQIFAGMEQAMGPQSIRLFGVPADSRFASKLVVADYRLKRIAMGHDPSPVREVVNYLDLAAKRPVPRQQPQHRWWFVANYDAVFHTNDNLGFELSGQGVEVTTARSSVAAFNGSSKKQDEPAATPTAKQFATSFTKHFPEIAQKIPVFAELQNLISLCVTAELIAQSVQGATRAWKPVHFVDEQACPQHQVAVPKQVPSIVSQRYTRSRSWLISVSGGVEINAAQLADRTLRKPAANAELAETRTSAHAPEQNDHWWWD